MNEAIRKEQLPKMKEYLSEEDYNHYNDVLSTNWSGLGPMDDYIFPRMFGYTDRYDYYENITVAEHAHKIKVPTFCFES